MLRSSLVLAALVLVANVSALSLTYKFQSYSTPACFWVNVLDTSQRLQFYFNIHENTAADMGHDVDYTITGPQGQLLQTQNKVSHADINVQPTQTGQHSICLKHSGSPSDKIIDLDFSLTKPIGDTKAADPLTASPTANLTKTCANVKQDLTDLYHTLRYVKTREKKNQETVLSIKWVVKWFSFFQCATVIGVGYAQVYVIKNFFSNSAKPRV